MYARNYRASFRYELIQVLRSINAGWYLGLVILTPFFFLLTSWTITQIIGSVNLGYFYSTLNVKNYMAYATLGFALWGITMNASWAGTGGLQLERVFGTAELMFLAPGSKAMWLLGKFTGDLVGALVSAAVVLASGLLLFPPSSSVGLSLAGSALGLLIVILGMVAFGFFVAGLTILVKAGDQIHQVLWPTLVFFSGFAFPVEALPQWARTVSWLIPSTHGLNIMRGTILLGLGLTNPTMISEILTSLILIAVYLPAGYFSFVFFYNRARKRGLVTTY